MPASKFDLTAMARRLRCTPAEAIALAVLSTAAVASLALVWVLTRGPQPSPVVAVPSESATGVPLDVSSVEVIVHVAGAVNRPGVYTLPGGSRVADAVTAAGGARPKAVLTGLNLARPLTDGEQVLVPDRKSAAATATQPGAGAPAAPGGGGTGLVSLNQATVTELETLPGIGPVLASRIVQHRDSVGGFTEVGQLRDVPGIGEKTFQALAELVSL